MRIVCPACQAAYNVPESVLGADARPVRCARCSHEWLPEAAPLPARRLPAESDDGLTLAAALAEAGSEAVEPVRAEAVRAEAAIAPDGPDGSRVPIAPPPPDGRLAMFAPLTARPLPPVRTITRAGWAASAALILIVLTAAYLWRAQVQAAWPPSQRAYAALGLR